MKFLAFSLVFILASYSLMAQCLERVSLTPNASTCKATLTASNLEIPLGQAEITKFGLIVHDGALPFEFSTSDNGSEFEVRYIKDLVQCLTIVKITACASPSPPSIISPTAGQVLDNGCENGINGINWHFEWTAVEGAVAYFINVKNPAFPYDIVNFRTFDGFLQTYYDANLPYADIFPFQTGWECKARAVFADGSMTEWSTPVPFSIEPVNTDCAPPAPTITSPVAGQVMDNACTSEGNPTIWNFSWTPVNGNTQPYNLVVEKVGAFAPQVDVLVNGNSYTYTSDLPFGGTGWQVKVRVKASDGNYYSQFSNAVPFTIEPMNTDCAPSAAPIITSPIAGQLMDNGCDDGNNPILWQVRWTPVLVNGSFQPYHVYIKRIGSDIPIYDGLQLSNSPTIVLTGYIVDANTTGWEMKVRTRNADGITFGPWSSTVTFNIEPVNTDCICPAPNAPILNYTVGNTFATLEWAAITGAVSYKVEYRPIGSGGNWLTATTTTPTATIYNLNAGLEYEFRVVTVCSSNRSSSPSPTSTMTLPCGSLLSAFSSNETTNSATLNWIPDDLRAQEYQILNENANILATVNGTSYTVQGLLPDNIYTFTISPKCNSSEGQSRTITVKTLPSPTPIRCPAPTNLRITQTTPTEATVMWNASTSVRRYKVECFLRGELVASLFTTSNTAIFNGLMPSDIEDNTYEITVTAICSESSSSTPSVSASFQTKSSCPEVDNVIVSYVSHTLATLTWNAVPEAENGYNVQYKVVGTSNSVEVQANTNSVILNNLMPNTQYEVRIKTKCAANKSMRYSPTVVFTTPVVICYMPTIIKVFNITATTANISWKSGNVAKEFELAYRKESSESWTTIKTDSKVHLLENLTPNTNYEYRLRTICFDGSTSDWTTTKVFTTANLANNNLIIDNKQKTPIASLDKAFTVDISPNPTDGQVFLDIQSAKEQNIDMQVINRLGQIVFKKSISAGEGVKTKLPIDLTQLSNDMYIVQFINGQDIQSHKILIQH